ncbi:hypothetical protein V8D89_011900 [Ganoderma adspersum]
MTHARRTDTTDPFDDPLREVSEEVILRSSDNIDLTVPMTILSEASCVLEDMLHASQPPPCPADTQDVVPGSPPIISLPEDGHTLEILFRLYIHGSDTVVTSLAEVESVLKAALKYKMHAAVTVLKARLLELGETDTNAHSAFDIACALGLVEESATLFPSACDGYRLALGDGIGGDHYRTSHTHGEPKTLDQEHGLEDEDEESCAVPSPLVTSPAVWRSRLPFPPSDDEDEEEVEEADEEEDEESEEDEEDFRGLLGTLTTDLVLKSTDEHLFHVHSTVLSLASPFFAKVIPRQAFTAAGEPLYPLMKVSEDGAVLSKLLRYVYPCPPYPPATLDALKPLLEAAHRWEVQPALAALRTILVSFLETIPSLEDADAISTALRVFVFAHRFGFRAERAAAVRALLHVHYGVLQDISVEELDEIPASVYYDLLRFHRGFGQGVFQHILQHALLQSGTHPEHIRIPDAIRDAFFSDEETPWKLDVLRLSEPDNHCADICFAVLDAADDPAWDDFQRKSMPRWWLRYVHEIAVRLQRQPLETRIVMDVDILQGSITTALECSECRVHFLPRFIAYAEGLKRELERTHARMEACWDNFIEDK